MKNSIYTSDALKFECASCGYCCDDWKIEIEEIKYNKQKKYFEDMPYYNEFIELQDNNKRRYYYKLNQKGRCCFVTEEGLCLIHKKLGYDEKSIVCKVYPLKFIDAFYEKTVSLEYSCRHSVDLLFDNEFRLIKEKQDGIVIEKEYFLNSKIKLRTDIYQKIENVFIELFSEAKTFNEFVLFIHYFNKRLEKEKTEIKENILLSIKQEILKNRNNLKFITTPFKAFFDLMIKIILLRKKIILQEKNFKTSDELLNFLNEFLEKIEYSKENINNSRKILYSKLKNNSDFIKSKEKVLKKYFITKIIEKKLIIRFGLFKAIGIISILIGMIKIFNAADENKEVQKMKNIINIVEKYFEHHKLTYEIWERADTLKAFENPDFIFFILKEH